MSSTEPTATYYNVVITGSTELQVGRGSLIFMREILVKAPVFVFWLGSEYEKRRELVHCCTVLNNSCRPRTVYGTMPPNAQWRLLFDDRGFAYNNIAHIEHTGHRKASVFSLHDYYSSIMIWRNTQWDCCLSANRLLHIMIMHWYPYG